MIARFLIPAVLALSACMPAGRSEAPTRALGGTSTLPPMKIFSAPQPVAPARSNRDIARDFLDLVFEMESGRTLPRLTRFEGPITLRVTGKPPASLAPDLTRLLHRLRNEAGLDIRQVNSGEANITVEAVSRTRIRANLPQAACFVVPNITSLSQYRSARRRASTDWARLDRRERIAVFVPNDSSPQEVRDCLHEELAQALGPLNDLYRLPDSVFNDDNVHAVLTGFDMLVLRLIYHPSLRNGMTRQEVRQRLPGLLRRLNPQGEGAPARSPRKTPQEWVKAVQTALGPGAGTSRRRAAAARALAIAQREGWRDHRLGFSHYAYARLLQNGDAEKAFEQFVRADRVYRRTPETGPHSAFVATQLAAYALSAGRGKEALALVEPELAVAARFENAALLSTLMLLRAEALALVGRTGDARSVRLDSIGWARYGFGAEWAVRAKLREIAALSPLNGSY